MEGNERGAEKTARRSNKRSCDKRNFGVMTLYSLSDTEKPPRDPRKGAQEGCKKSPKGPQESSERAPTFSSRAVATKRLTTEKKGPREGVGGT